MVKKVDGPGRVQGTSRSIGISPTKPVETKAVDSIENVSGTSRSSRIERARRRTRPMTAEEREHLFRLIHEEAERMFGPNGLPESQRNTVENAVKMAIDASSTESEENES